MWLAHGEFPVSRDVRQRSGHPPAWNLPGDLVVGRAVGTVAQSREAPLGCVEQVQQWSG